MSTQSIRRGVLCILRTIDLAVSIRSTIPKIMDEIIYNILYASKFNKRFYKSQHGFVNGRSVVPSLLGYSDDTVDSISKGIVVDGIYLDLLKAFDTLDHDLLKQKLYQIVKISTLSEP